jgi:hypothetical protein
MPVRVSWQPSSWLNLFRNPPVLGRVLQDLLHRGAPRHETLEKVHHVVTVERLSRRMAVHDAVLGGVGVESDLQQAHLRLLKPKD